MTEILRAHLDYLRNKGEHAMALTLGGAIEALVDQCTEAEERITRALEYAGNGGFDGARHKMWAIDQMVRALTGCPVEEQSFTDCRGEPYTAMVQGESEAYRAWVEDYEEGEEGPHTFEWDKGVSP